MKEQQERNETENVLKELIEEAQELRHSREHDRSAIASVKKEKKWRNYYQRRRSLRCKKAR